MESYHGPIPEEWLTPEEVEEMPRYSFLIQELQKRVDDSVWKDVEEQLVLMSEDPDAVTEDAEYWDDELKELAVKYDRTPAGSRKRKVIVDLFVARAMRAVSDGFFELSNIIPTDE